MRALVTGGTGFVGHSLLPKLERPVVLSRNAAKAEKSLQPFGVRALAWDPENEPAPAAAFEGIDAVFHLAGDSVGEGRWTESKKARIRDSRVLGTRNLVATLRNLPAKPKVLVSGSAVGYYGSRGDAEIDERSPPADDFLAQVCRDWEKEAVAASEFGMRVVLIRTGIVLGKKGGALSQMLTPFSLGLGSPLGSGNQYMPWVHIDDLVGLMLFAARENNIAGPLNGVSPHPVTNREFTKVLGKVLSKPTFLPAVSAFVLKIVLGEFADVLLGSQRVYPRAALAAGFAFRFPDLESALREILRW